MLSEEEGTRNQNMLQIQQGRTYSQRLQKKANNEEKKGLEKNRR